jgi:hypothetical protein
MSRLASAGIAALSVLGLAGAAMYWIHGRSSGAAPTMAATPTAPPVSPAPAEPVGKAAVRAPAAGVAASKAAAPEAGAALPVRSGEVLEFTADLANVSNVANLRLQVGEHRNFQGKNAWHFQAFAHTENPLRMVFVLDDQFDSYSDAGTMQSLQSEMHLNERGQKVDSVQRITTTGKEPAPADATEARVLPGTRDPLGMMQFLRGVDWTKTHEVRGPVYDGRKLYDLKAALVGSAAAVTVPAGNFTTNKVEIRVFTDGAEVKDAHFYLYLDHDAARTPVLLEAVLPISTARVALKSKK